MSDSYWRGNLREAGAPMRSMPGREAFGQTPAGQEAAPTTDAYAPEAPQPVAGTSSSYWQGDFRARAEGEMPGSPTGWHDGSVSARARQAYAVEALRQKDHIAAGLLAIFLGMFGVHKFYLGCNQAGFIMLAVSIIGGVFTFGLAAAVIEVIAVIEGVIYLTKSQTEFDREYVLTQRDWF